MFRAGFILAVAVFAFGSLAAAQPALPRAALPDEARLEGWLEAPQGPADVDLKLRTPTLGARRPIGPSVHLLADGALPRLDVSRVEPEFDGGAATHMERIPSAMELERHGDLRILLDRLDRRIVAAMPARRVRVGMPQVYRGVGPMDFMLVVRGRFQ